VLKHEREDEGGFNTIRLDSIKVAASSGREALRRAQRSISHSKAIEVFARETKTKRDEGKSISFIEFDSKNSIFFEEL
jgi:hypothetical protein